MADGYGLDTGPERPTDDRPSNATVQAQVRIAVADGPGETLERDERCESSSRGLRPLTCRPLRGGAVTAAARGTSGAAPRSVSPPLRKLPRRTPQRCADSPPTRIQLGIISRRFRGNISTVIWGCICGYICKLIRRCRLLTSGDAILNGSGGELADQTGATSSTSVETADLPRVGSRMRRGSPWCVFPMASSRPAEQADFVGGTTVHRGSPGQADHLRGLMRPRPIRMPTHSSDAVVQSHLDPRRLWTVPGRHH